MTVVAQTEMKSKIVEDGGTGPYKAIMKEEATLAAHTVFVPQELKSFGQENPLPVLVWGNGMPPKEKLKEIHTPVIYILGGETDIAYGNGMDDFHRIDHVPAIAANYPVGHGGTYRQPHGGEFTVVAQAWLDWQLKGDAEAAKMFVGKDCGLSKREKWTIEKSRERFHDSPLLRGTTGR